MEFRQDGAQRAVPLRARRNLMEAGEGSTKGMIWTGRVISGLLALFLLFDAAMKIVKAAPVLEASAKLGWPENVAVGIGIALLGSTVLYLIPQTSILGAILLTGYLGGATATHVRVGQPFYFPIVFGVLVWLGIYLREARVRALVPIRG